VQQFKPVFQVEGTTFSPMFFGYFIADWLLYNLPLEVFTQRNFVADYSTEIEFYFEKPKNRSLSHILGDKKTLKIAF